MSIVPDRLLVTAGQVVAAAGAPRPFGWHLEFNLGGCDLATLTDEAKVAAWGASLAEHIGMTSYREPIVDLFGVGHLEGLTGIYRWAAPGVRTIQRWTTSAAVVHADPPVRGVYGDAFSCKPFDPQAAIDFTIAYFAATAGLATFRIRRVPRADAGFTFDWTGDVR
jgi:hypothetical protein